VSWQWSLYDRLQALSETLRHESTHNVQVGSMSGLGPVLQVGHADRDSWGDFIFSQGQGAPFLDTRPTRSSYGVLVVFNHTTSTSQAGILVGNPSLLPLSSRRPYHWQCCRLHDHDHASDIMIPELTLTASGCSASSSSGSNCSSAVCCRGDLNLG
jgi:hypothetical protein